MIKHVTACRAPCLPFWFALCLPGFLFPGESVPFRVAIDASESPVLEPWAKSAEALGTEWFGRIVNLIGSPEHPAETQVFHVILREHYQGIASTAGGTITMASRRVTENPEDSRGVIIHELTHVIQSYPGGSEPWIVEGIADYVRFGIYEAKPLSWFPRPQKKNGYRDSYQVSAGFLFWLEAGPAPGIVRRLNIALQAGRYDEALFAEAAGRPLDALWDAYLNEFSHVAPAIPELPAVLTAFRYAENGGGSFEHLEDARWIEIQHGEERWRFTETGRTRTHVELWDEGRNLRLRLTAADVRMQRGLTWPRLYPGRWDPAPP